MFKEHLYVACKTLIYLFGATYSLMLVFKVICDYPTNWVYSLVCAVHFGPCANIGGCDELSLGPAMSHGDQH